MALLLIPQRPRSSEDVIRDAFAALGCERWGGPSVNGWSRQDEFLRCPYRYWLKHERGLTPRSLLVDSSTGQDVGSYTHVFLAAHYASMLPPPVDLGGGQVQIYPGWRKRIPTIDELSDAFLNAGADATALQITHALWEAYLDQWCEDHWQPVAVEMPAGNPAVHTSRYDLVFFVEDGIHDGLWIGEHKTAHPSTDFEQWEMHGETLGEVFSWELSKLDELFGDKLRGVCINLLIKTKVPTYRRLWYPVNERLVREFVRSRFHWAKMEDVYRKSGVWPKSLHGCLEKFNRCGYWDHCTTLNDDLLAPIER